jgi:inosine-uridine nucleoside N-ribohydrolase
LKKVIFDTDIGIDDAMALLFLHYAPEVELQAIVTGFGNASIDDTTRNALFVRERFNIEAPVYRGAGDALGARLGEGYPDFVHGRNGLGDIAIPEPATDCDALPGPAAIVRIVKANPGEISIVAVGRLTNLALALEQCPDLPQLVGELVVMGGAFGYNGHRGNVSPVAEANIAGDPLAADRVFSSGFNLTIVGLDVTQETIADERFFAELRGNAGDAGKFIHGISRCYLDFHERLTGGRECPVHDSSAVACLLQPQAYTTITAAVRVATDGVAIGQTIAGDPRADYASAAWRDRPPVRICTAVDDRLVLQQYLDTLALAGDQL